ncbi:MAG TPA: trypsin-like peptidase domain-containing protein [Solirubrobacteraceae bacterium]|nr:trypsin-like peptidase domain-containing protein [Solirubrobacteraceae bacterium]
MTGAMRMLRRFGSAAATVVVVAACGGGATLTTTVTGTPAGGAASSGESLQAQYVSVVKATQPEVVQIRSDTGLGSGVVFDGAGNIVTNAHVVSGATSLQVTLADGRRFPARLVGAYTPDDLAVISIGKGHNVKPATFADSSKLAVGEIVLAVGNPLGLQSSVTDGIVSALGRNVSEQQGVVIADAIQTSAAINPGNSGGALIDLQARVVGIPTLAAVNADVGGTAAGIGFAIPSNTVTDIAGQIVREGRVVNSHRAALGISIADSPSRSGAIVAAVQSGGPAAKAGIVAGDAIVKVDGNQITSASDLASALADHEPGEKVTVTLTGTDGSTRSATVTLGQLPGS